MYKRITNVINFDNYYLEINNLIDNLTSFIYKNVNSTSNELYDYIIASITVFIISAYVQLQIDKSDDDTIVYIIPNANADEYTKSIAQLINNVKELSMFKDKLNLLKVSIIFVTSFKDFTIRGITFKHVPVGLQSVITSTLIKINSDWITPKIITFTDSNEYIYHERDEIFISYKTNLHTLQYNIIYALVKDKLLVHKNNEYWEQAFIQSIDNKSAIDGCVFSKKYFYSSQAEFNANEYFLSYIIAFILDPEQLQIINFNHYQKIQSNNF